MSQTKHSEATTKDSGTSAGDGRQHAARRATKTLPRLRSGVQAGGVGLGPDDELPPPPDYISRLWV